MERGAFPDVLFAVNLATGIGGRTDIILVFSTASLPPVLNASRLTENDPVVVYLCTGFRTVEKFPSPKDQFQEEGKCSDVSLNWIVRGTSPVVIFAVKFATGGKDG